MAQFWQKAIRSVDKLNERTHGWLGIFANATGETLKPASAITAAAIAYFALLSLFPLILLSIAIASFVLGPLMDQQVIVQQLEFIAPALGQLLGQNIEGIIQTRGSITGIALVGLIWSASTFFSIAYSNPASYLGYQTSAPSLEATRPGNSICPGICWPGSLPGFVCQQHDCRPPNLAAHPDHTGRKWSQLSRGVFARCSFVHAAVYYAPAWSCHLAGDFTRSNWGGLVLGNCQESVFTFCLHLCLCIKSGLWFTGSVDRLFVLGLPERTYFSIWRLLERRVLPDQTTKGIG